MTNNIDSRERALLSVTGGTYIRATAIEIVRAIEADTHDYTNKGGTLSDFLRWSLARLRASIPRRELDLGQRVGDETLALSFLLLLDEYGIGKLTTDAQSKSKYTYTFET